MYHSQQPHSGVTQPTCSIDDTRKQHYHANASQYTSPRHFTVSSDLAADYNQVFGESISPQPFCPDPQVTDRSSNETKLIAIPATGHKAGSPIMRAWPPALEAYGLSKDEFLQFIDRLNRVTVSSPPFQVLGLAGNIVGMVPLATAQIVGGAVNVGAMVAGAALRMGHTEILMRQANHDLFNPLGLNIKLAKMDSVARLAKIPLLNDRGRLLKNSHALPSLDRINSQAVGAHQRRLMALQPFLSPLSQEALPEEDKPTNYLARMHATVSARQAAKEEKDMIKKRGKSGKDEEERALLKVIFLIVENVPKQSWDGVGGTA